MTKIGKHRALKRRWSHSERKAQHREQRRQARVTKARVAGAR